MRPPLVTLPLFAEESGRLASRLCMIIGAPGAGKSTLVRTLASGAESRICDGPGFRYTLWNPGSEHEVAELGLPDDSMGFRGSDRLRSNVAVDVYRWMEQRVGDVLVEGDRLTTGRMATVAQRCGFALEVLYLYAPEDVLAARRAARYAEYKDTYHFQTRDTTGPPNETWVKGRASKAANLAEAAGAVLLDATRPPVALAAAAARRSVVCRKLARAAGLAGGEE